VAEGGTLSWQGCDRYLVVVDLIVLQVAVD
jgi:hypothetical protein